MKDLARWSTNILLCMKQQMSEIFATQTIVIYSYFKHLRTLWLCGTVKICKGCCETSFLPSFFATLKRKKLFKNTVTLAVEVFKKLGVEFLSFIRLKGWIHKQNLTAVKVSSWFHVWNIVLFYRCPNTLRHRSLVLNGLTAQNCRHFSKQSGGCSTPFSVEISS